MRNLFVFIIMLGLFSCKTTDSPSIPHFFSIHGFLTAEVKGDIREITDHNCAARLSDDGTWEYIPDSTVSYIRAVFDRDGLLARQETTRMGDGDTVTMTYHHFAETTIETISGFDEPAKYTFSRENDMLHAQIDYGFLIATMKLCYENGELASLWSKYDSSVQERVYEYDESGRVSRLGVSFAMPAVYSYEYLTFDDPGNWTSRLEYSYRQGETEPWKISLTERQITYY